MKRAALAGRIRTLLLEGRGSLRAGEKDGWGFVTRACGKFQKQLDRYDQLPSLEDLVERRAALLLPQYAGILESCQEDSVSSYISRFTANAEDTEGMKVKNLIAHLIKHKIHNDYVDIRQYRESVLSRGFDEKVTKERVVNTYTRVSMVKFVQILHDNVFWYRNAAKYYKELNKHLRRVLGDEKALRRGKLCMALRPADVELLIKRMMYANKMMSTEQRVESKIEKMNRAIIADFRDSELKLSNKELFALLRVSGVEDRRQVEILYEQFMHSVSFEKNSDFFKHFLSCDVTNEFKSKIVQDTIDRGVELDRYVLKSVLQHASTVRDEALAQTAAAPLLEQYAVDSDTMRAVQSGIDAFVHSEDADYDAEEAAAVLSAVSARHFQLTENNTALSRDKQRFLVRVLDVVERELELEELEEQETMTGLVFKY